MQKINFVELMRYFIPSMRQVAREESVNVAPFVAYLGIVDSVSGDFGTITLIDDSVTLPQIVNKTGETLSSGDRVWVCAINGDLGNAFIWVRLENDIT